MENVIKTDVKTLEQSEVKTMTIQEAMNMAIDAAEVAKKRQVNLSSEDITKVAISIWISGHNDNSYRNGGNGKVVADTKHKEGNGGFATSKQIACLKKMKGVKLPNDLTNLTVSEASLLISTAINSHQK